MLRAEVFRVNIGPLRRCLGNPGLGSLARLGAMHLRLFRLIVESPVLRSFIAGRRGVSAIQVRTQNQVRECGGGVERMAQCVLAGVAEFWFWLEGPSWVPGEVLAAFLCRLMR